MSDVQERTGWWMASDGNWYPPADNPPRPGWWLASDGKWYPPYKTPRVIRQPASQADGDDPTAPQRVLWRRHGGKDDPASHRSDGRQRAFTVVVAVGGLLMILGSLLPWATVSAGSLSATAYGTTSWGDGWITWPCGSVIALSAVALWLWRARILNVVAVVFSLAGVGISIYEIVDISRLTRSVDLGHTSLGLHATIAYGLVLVALAALVAIVGAVGALARQDRHGAEGGGPPSLPKLHRPDVSGLSAHRHGLPM